MSWATWVRFLMIAERSAAPRPFCVALSPSVHWHARFLYCCALYNFFFLGFRQWRSRADRVLTLNMSIQLPLFWSTWSRTRGPDLAPTCAGMAHRRDYIDCSLFVEPPSLRKCPKSAWPMNFRKYLKTRANWEGFSTLNPQTAFRALLQVYQWSVCHWGRS